MNTLHDKDKQLPASFVGKSGKFYVRQRRADGSGFHHRLTVWPSVDDYNQRTPVPLAFCDAIDGLRDFDREVKIYAESLTTTPPAYPRDSDESDVGVTPRRNVWHNRFQKAREGRSHAA